MNNQIFSQITYVIGRIGPGGIDMLGTGFLISKSGKVATTFHAIGNQTSNLVIILPQIKSVDSYQDLSDMSCNYAFAKPLELDPIKDIAILQVNPQPNFEIPVLDSFDAVKLGESIQIFGYPHCTMHRRSFTLQSTEIGSKVLMKNSGIASKHAVINTQARPGQSGSPVFNPKTNKILGMLIGAWVPAAGGISFSGVNPLELHQTTHCISAEHIKDMV
jgi:S1-C subfamily serine protease